MDILFLLIGLVVGGVIAIVVYLFLGRQNRQLLAQNKLLQEEADKANAWKANSEALQSRIADLQHEMGEYKTKIEEKNAALQTCVQDVVRYKTMHAHAEEKLATQKNEITALREELNREFKLHANEILEEKTKKFSEINEEKIANILNPLKEKIQTFEKKVEETYNHETREKASLREELKQIITINRQMSDDAQRLTSALKGDSKTQGDWGEMQLERLLEKSGLQKDVHYLKQENYKTEEGKDVRPDYVINLPESKHFVIDCKVSLTAYERYHNAEDGAQKTLFLKEHISSINQHIADLGSKNYQNLYGINAPDFVFMYVALEPALTIALQNDLNVFDKAFLKNIVLVSSTTLLATMRTVSFIWKQENQRKNVIEIAREGGALYDKFVGFVEDLIAVGKRMDDAKKEYAGAMNKLFESSKKGDTIIGRVEKLKDLGANATKQLPQALLERIE
jgi:DNA recombination protein RmuC